MLQLNKKIYLPVLIVLAFGLYSCGGKKENTEKKEKLSYKNPESVLQHAREIMGENVKVAFAGRFDRDTVTEIASGSEIKNNNEWGIKFVLLKATGNKFGIVFQTALLNGSFRESLVKKITLPKIDYDFIYYNSEDYYLGSGGGEVYSYIINFNEGKTYYAHLISEPKKPTSLYLSDNIDIPDVKKFLIENFKKDFPGIKIVSKDIVLKY